MRIAYKILLGRPEGKISLERPMCRWEYNIKMHLGEIGCEHLDWVHLAEGRDQWRALVCTVMNLSVP
jgi:hypothetical protein